MHACLTINKIYVLLQYKLTSSYQKLVFCKPFERHSAIYVFCYDPFAKPRVDYRLIKYIL